MTMSMVLIAHDDPILVAELSQILCEGGVERVLTARNKHQVVSAVREHGHEIDLIVHDVLMDEMDGFQLLPLLKRSFFEGRLLFTSVDGSLAIMASIVASENGVDVIGVIPAPLKPGHEILLLDQTELRSNGKGVGRMSSLEDVVSRDSGGLNG